MEAKKTRVQAATEKAEKMLREAEKEDLIVGLLPREPRTVCVHKDCTSVSFNPIKLEELRSFVDSLLPHIIEAEHWKDGCTSVSPVEINRTEKRESAVMDGASFAEVCLNSYGSRGEYQDAELTVWLKIDEEIIKAHVKIEPTPWKWLPGRRITWQGGYVSSFEVEPRFLGEDQRRNWWSEPPAYRISYYWADQANFLSWLSTQGGSDHG
jgi:hypothetical protein